jgi:hypothetical protein
MPKSLTVQGHVKDHWKPETVLFDLGIQPVVRIPAG